MINYGKRQFIRYVMMGLAFALVSFILSSCEVNAETFATSQRVTYYSDSALTTQYNNLAIFAQAENINSINNTISYRNTDFYFSDIDLTDYQGGNISFNFNIVAPVVNRTTSETYQQTYYVCEQWVSGQNVYNCSRLIPYYNNDLENSSSVIQPTINVQAILWEDDDNGTVACQIAGNLINCPIKDNANKINRLRISSSVNYGNNFSAGAYQYSIWLGRNLNIYADTTKEIIKEMEDNQQETINTITDDSDQDVSSMSNATGWLPQGTIDGLINLPIALVQSINTGLQGSCTPLTLPLPFVNEDMTLPCIKTIFDQINGVNTLLNLICTPIMAIILYNYLKNLFQWIQSQIAMEGNSNWGGV